MFFLVFLASIKCSSTLYWRIRKQGHQVVHINMKDNPSKNQILKIYLWQNICLVSSLGGSVKVTCAPWHARGSTHVEWELSGCLLILAVEVDYGLKRATWRFKRGIGLKVNQKQTVTTGDRKSDISLNLAFNTGIIRNNTQKRYNCNLIKLLTLVDSSMYST